MQSYYMNKSARVRLDDYICDLNLEVAPGGYACKPLSAEGFSYMWAGCKATFGIRSGKVCYEAKILEYNDVTCKDVDSHVARVGWSTDDATLQLGEDKNSFGFGGTGKKSVNRKFANYGRRFEKGDVVGCYLAMENGWVDISYTVNGRFCGSAFKIRWMTDEALFPHILSKNCKMEVNFGQANHPYFSLQPGFKLIDHVPPDFLIPAARCPASQKDCEIIMMVGLPGVGKSTWAMNYAKIHPSKKYVILGTDSIIDKMRVQGLHRKNNFSGRWDVLIKQASDCFNTLLKKASNLPRNLILDQTNVYASARRRKVKQYREKGYTINAMVLVPRDEDMIRRSEQRTLEEGKEVPESAVLEMKANFSIPHENEGLFDKITFLELQRDEAQDLVEQYNREANAKGYQSNKQKGQSRHMNQTERKSNRYFSQSSDSYQDQPQNRQQQGGYPPNTDDRYQSSRGPPPVKSYEEEMRGAKKRADSSTNYGPPDKYRRSGSPSNFNRQTYPGSQSQQYSADFNPKDSYSGGPSATTGPDQWGSKQQGGNAATSKPYIKEEPSHPLARGDSRSQYNDPYGPPGTKNDGYDQYSNVKSEQSSYNNLAYPRQGGYGTGQSSYGNDQYYSQNSNQNAPSSQSQSYGPPGTDQYGYSGVKNEPNASDSWYDQGSQNYSGSDASYQQTQSVKPDPYQQQGAYYDSSQQFGGASNKGYGAAAKSEAWGGQPSQPYPQSQQYDGSADNQASNQYGVGGYDSYSDRSNSQQWNQSNANKNYQQGSQGNRQQQPYPGQQVSNSNNASGNQYGSSQGNYGYDGQSTYGDKSAKSFNPPSRDQAFGSDQYQDYNQKSSLQSNQSFPLSRSGFETKREPQSWDTQGQHGQQQEQFSQSHGQYGQTQGQYGQSQGQYGQSQGQYGQSQGQFGQSQGQYGQWDSGRPAPKAEKSWDQPRNDQPAFKRQPSPLPGRMSDRPLQPPGESNMDMRPSQQQWSGQNQRPGLNQRSEQGQRPSRFDVRPPAGKPGILSTPPGEKSKSIDQFGTGDQRPPRDERERSPRNDDRNRRSRFDEPRPGKRDEPPPRRDDRDEPRRGGDREDSYSRRGGRDAPRRSERDEPSRHGGRSEPQRRGDRDGSRRGDREDSRSRPDRGRDSSRLRHDRKDDRDRSRGDDRRSDSRTSRDDSSDRGRRDRPSRDDRRPRDDRERSSDRPDRFGRPSSGSPSVKKPEDPVPKPTGPPKKPPPHSPSQKMGLLPLPEKSLISPTEKAGLSSKDAPSGQAYVDEATSKLSSVDFDKLKASLVNLRKQNLKLTKETSPPTNQSAGSDMEIVPDEELNTNVVEVSSKPPALMALKPRGPPPSLAGHDSLLGRPPSSAGRESLLGRPPLSAERESLLGPPPPSAERESLLGPPPGPRPRGLMEGSIRSDAPRMRLPAPEGISPRDSSGPSLLGRPPTRHDGPRQPRGPRGPGLRGPPRRPLLDTPPRQEHAVTEAIIEEEVLEQNIDKPHESLSRPPRPIRPRMLRPRLRGPRPGGMRPLLRPGVRPRLRPPGPRGFGRPPFMRGAPRRPMAPRLGPM